MKAIIVLILLGWAYNGSSQAKKDTVKVGIYIENIYDFNFTAESFKCDYWLWCNSRNHALIGQMPKMIEVIRSKGTSVELEDTSSYGDTFSYERKEKAELLHKWNIKHFPFDKQRIEIETEIYAADTSQLYVALDSARSNIDKEGFPGEWKIKESEFHRHVVGYNTNFGDPSTKSEKYYSIVYSCELKRNVFGLFIKLFAGVFIAFCIAMSSLFISSRHSDPRFGLPVGALFAGIANKYVVDTIIPQTTYLTLVDKIHFLTFSMILLMIVLSIISQRKYFGGREKASHNLDRITFWSILTIYLVTILCWIM